VDPRDETQSLDDRARSYLHANCSMCHHPGGNAIVSFYLRRELPFEKLNTNKGTGIGTFGMQDAKIIVPGDPYRSVLMYRMSKLGYARMPYIGSRVVDGFGVGLIENWILSLPAEPGRALSQLTKMDSPETRALKNLIVNDAEAQNAADVTTLLASTEGSLALVGKMHMGLLDRPAFDVAVARGKDAKADVRGLFETFVPEADRRATLGPDIKPETILDIAGNASRGQLIFLSDSARCRNCHDLSSREQSIGPTLLDIKKKYPLKTELLQHVLQPSLKIEEAFVSYSVLTTTGRIHAGLLIQQDDNAVVLKTAEKKTVTIPREEIEDMKKSTQSLMPDRILSDLTAQEAADLLSYLMSLEVKP
jgi:putative heme-binding domain-containing protein